jgi:hypothetical protein
VVICIEEVAAEILVTYFYLLLTLHDGLMELGGHYELSALLGGKHCIVTYNNRLIHPSIHIPVSHPPVKYGGHNSIIP